MGKLLRRGPLCLVVLSCALVCAPAALAADSVHVTRFSRSVDGNAGGAFTITVSLLRNISNVDGLAVRQQVDQFTTTSNGGGVWSGSFPTHAFSSQNDQIEVVYSGAGAPPQVTFGDGPFLQSASVPPAHTIDARADAFDGSIGIASDGATAHVSGCSCDPVTATVNGGAPLSPVADVFTFAPHLTNNDAVLFTGTFTGGGTTVKLTAAGPLLSPQPSDQPAPFTDTGSSVPGCSAYLDTSEVVCSNLTPGAFTLKHLRGAATLATQPFTVPSRTATLQFIPTLGGAPVPGLAAGDQVQLLFGAHVLTTLTINPMTFTRISALTDGASSQTTTVTGTCTPGEFFNDGSDLCASGAIPSPNNLTNQNTALFEVGGVRNAIGQLDDTSPGSTEIDLPTVALQSPFFNESIRLPFAAFALARYNDPLALVAQANNDPAFGNRPPLTSTPSADPVTLGLARLGSSSFVQLGNANTAAGLRLSNLSTGPYVMRLTIADPRGDVEAYDTPLVVQGSAPQGPPVPGCTVKSSGGLKASIAKRTKHKPKPKPKPKPIKLTVRCGSPVAGARVALWLSRGGSLVASGGGVIRRGRVTITLTGKLKRGTYLLNEVIDSGGSSTSATKTLKLR